MNSSNIAEISSDGFDFSRMRLGFASHIDPMSKPVTSQNRSSGSVEEEIPSFSHLSMVRSTTSASLYNWDFFFPFFLHSRRIREMLLGEFALAAIAAGWKASEAAAIADEMLAERNLRGLDGLRTKSVEELGLSQRIVRILKRGGVKTIGDLVGLTERDLAMLPNMGPTSVTEIRTRLADMGFKLAGDE